MGNQFAGYTPVPLVAEKKLFVDQVSITRSEFGETGEYDLEGLFIRIADAVNRVGARRVVLDTIEALVGELPSLARANRPRSRGRAAVGGFPGSRGR